MSNSANNKRIAKSTLVLYVQYLFLTAYVMLAGCALPVVAAEEHKIVIIADPHVMVDELLVKDGAAFQNYLGGRANMVDFSKAIFDKVVSDIAMMSPKPELVLIVGDISKDGELVNHLYVKGKLDELRDAGVPTLVIPGNHDSGQRAPAVYYDGDSTYAAATCVRYGSDDNSLEQIYAEYGFQTCYKDQCTITESVERASEKTLTYACEPIDGLVIIGIDSGTAGTLSKSTLNWVCSKVQSARGKGKLVLAMMHHPVISHHIGANHIYYPSKKSDTGNGCETVRNRLADAGINVIFTGHTHCNDIMKDWNADFSRTIYDITTGGLGDCCLYYRIVTISEDLNKLSVTTSQVTDIGNSLTGKAFDMDDAKSRFTSSGVVAASAKKLIANGVDQETATLIAPYLQLAKVYREEGDEHKNSEAQELLATLNGMNIESQYYLDVLNSMLLDLSNYGDVERENQTDDNTVEITLDRGATAVSKVIEDSKYSDGGKWYTVEGTQLTDKPTQKGIYISDGRKMIMK